MKSSLFTSALTGLIGGLFLKAGSLGGGYVPPVPNAAPLWTSPSSFSVAEGVSGTIYTCSATDGDGDTLVYSIAGGADAAKFALAGAALRFVAAPDWDIPGDANLDNLYEVVLAVSDGVNAPVPRPLSISLTNVFEVALAGVTVTPISALTGAQAAGTILATITGRASGDDLTLTGALAAAGAVFNAGKTQILAGLAGLPSGSYGLAVVQSHPDAAANASTGSTIVVASAASPGSAATAFPIVPTVHYHPHSQAGTVSKSGSVITACPDLSGLAPFNGLAADGVTVVGPVEKVEPIVGRKFWDFNGGTQYGTISNALSGLSNRALTILAVIRVPHQRSVVNMVVPRFATYASDTSNTAPSGLFAGLKTNPVSGGAALLFGAPAATANVSGDAYKVIPGTQLQVAGVAFRTTANGGTRFLINADSCDVGQQTTALTGYLGMIIGAAAGASNTAGVTTTVNNCFDLYELAIWVGELTNAQVAAASAAMVANYAISQLDSQYLFDGDSELDGIPTTLGISPAYHGAVASQLTEPGAGLMPANVRVLNLATSGALTAGVVTRRDAANATSTMLYPGGPSKNVFTCMLGRNDFGESGGKKNSAMFYADVVAVVNTTTTGYLQRGWKCYWAANIAQNGSTVTTNVSPSTENTLQKRIEAFRALIAVEATHTPNPQFLTDTRSNTGQTYEGLVGVVHLYDIQDDRPASLGAKWFYDLLTISDRANATPPGPMDLDDTHPVVSGHVLMASGGRTPQFGFKSVFS